MMESKTVTGLNISYSVYSGLFFAAFQLLLFPLMVIGAGMQIELLYKITAVQSIVVTAAVNYLLVGSSVPGTIYEWYLIGVPSYALVGWVLGFMLQNRFSGVNQWIKLIGSFLIFEVILSGIVIVVHHHDLLGLAPGW